MSSITNVAGFYEGIRVVTGPLKQTQVDVIGRLLVEAARWPIGWISYGLATAWHEARLTPQDERGQGVGHPYGNPGKHNGQIPFGRGLVQITWDSNYEWADKICADAGLTKAGDILANFELANRPDVACEILIRGMETGHFTGRKLADYIATRGTQPAFINARRIINGQDKAADIAEYADHFQTAFDQGGWK